VDTFLDENELRERYRQSNGQPANPAEIDRVHDHKYIDEIERYAAAGGAQIEAETVISQRSLEVANVAAGAVCDAVRRIAGVAVARDYSGGRVVSVLE